MDYDKDRNCVGILVLLPNVDPPLIHVVEGCQVPGGMALLPGGVLGGPRGHGTAEGRLCLPQ
eukprot:4988394-Alexandrium_andersonii.AAC.1